MNFFKQIIKDGLIYLATVTVVILCTCILVIPIFIGIMINSVPLFLFGISSEWICEDCGAEPRENGKRVIWTSSSGWIRNLCQDCARKYMEIDHPEWTKEELDVELEKQKVVNSRFGYTQFGKEHKKVTYKETEDGWLEVDKVEIEK